MKYLADTHIILWYLNGDERLPDAARNIIDDEHNEIYFSLVSMWEIEIKHIAHPEIMISSGETILEKCKQYNFLILPVNEYHIKALHSLHRAKESPKHNDPFDRMLISQAKVENTTLITHDTMLPCYNEPCVLLV